MPVFDRIAPQPQGTWRDPDLRRHSSVNAAPPTHSVICSPARAPPAFFRMSCHELTKTLVPQNLCCMETRQQLQFAREVATSRVSPLIIVLDLFFIPILLRFNEIQPVGHNEKQPMMPLLQYRTPADGRSAPLLRRLSSRQAAFVHSGLVLRIRIGVLDCRRLRCRAHGH